MIEEEAIIRQVRRNCSISDSQNAGCYSVCGLVLRLRDLYKWEKRLDPWAEEEPAVILEWIGEKEEEWEELLDVKYSRISISDATYDPFDVRGINTILEPDGLFYAAGYFRGLKPSFVLGVIEEKREIEGYPVYILGRELARDLVAVPAFVQDECIVVRKEAARFIFWDQIIYVGKSGRPALRFALQAHGLEEHGAASAELLRQLPKIWEAEMETYIYHELGELRDTVLDRDLWRNLIAKFPHTPTELLARSVKDLLADTNRHGTLQHIIKARKSSSLGFYVAFLDGLRKELFPEIREVFQEFARSGNWEAVEKALAAGHRRARWCAESLSRIYRSGEQTRDLGWIERQIEKETLQPLGLVKNRQNN
jgi:hypothetical protein